MPCSGLDIGTIWKACVQTESGFVESLRQCARRLRMRTNGMLSDRDNASRPEYVFHEEAQHFGGRGRAARGRLALELEPMGLPDRMVRNECSDGEQAQRRLHRYPMSSAEGEQFVPQVRRLRIEEQVLAPTAEVGGQGVHGGVTLLGIHRHGNAHDRLQRPIDPRSTPPQARRGGLRVGTRGRKRMLIPHQLEEHHAQGKDIDTRIDPGWRKQLLGGGIGSGLDESPRPVRSRRRKPLLAGVSAPGVRRCHDAEHGRQPPAPRGRALRGPRRDQPSALHPLAAEHHGGARASPRDRDRAGPLPS
jgi:hypothetical protein